MTKLDGTPSIKVIDRNDGTVLYSVPLFDKDSDGNWMATEAIQKAIDWAANHAGTTVLLPDAHTRFGK